MKIKKIKIVIVLTLLFAMITSNVYAYVTLNVRPTTKSLYFTTNNLTSAEMTAALNASYEWNTVSNGIVFSRSGDRSGTISTDDSYTDVGSESFSSSPYCFTIPSNVASVCLINQNSNYNKFDILLNTDHTWIDGDNSSATYLDRQGTFTHEFGHAAGLNHNNTIPGNVSPDKASPSEYQTMYGFTSDPLGRNITYYQRTLQADDINGVQYVASQIK